MNKHFKTLASRISSLFSSYLIVTVVVNSMFFSIFHQIICILGKKKEVSFVFAPDMLVEMISYLFPCNGHSVVFKVYFLIYCTVS